SRGGDGRQGVLGNCSVSLCLSEVGTQGRGVVGQEGSLGLGIQRAPDPRFPTLNKGGHAARGESAVVLGKEQPPNTAGLNLVAAAQRGDGAQPFRGRDGQRKGH